MIYLLEDDESIRKLVVYALQSQGFEAAGFERPSEFWRAVGRQLPEMVLLDVMLPEEDGLSVLKKLRDASATQAIPVIMLTAKNTEFDRVTGLDCGADDFVSKPFGMMELLARVRAVLRRTEKVPQEQHWQVGPLYVCPQRRQVQVNGQEVLLTYKEFEMPVAAFTAAGQGDDKGYADGPGMGLGGGAGEPHPGCAHPYSAAKAGGGRRPDRDCAGRGL